MLENSSQFLSSEQPCEPKSLNVALNIAEVEKYTQLGKLVVAAQASQAKNTWCKGQFVYIENCMGKSPLMKKKMCN